MARTVFRAHHPHWAFDPLSGAGAARHGGRFNRVDQPALYTALRFETAWLEAQQGFARKTQPLTLCAYEVDCADVLDLTDDEALRAQHIAADDLACAWEAIADAGGTPPSWIIADRLRADGIAGIIVPSFAAGATSADRNAVFWTWGREPPHRVVLIDDHARLPPPLA
ncbi:MAG: RES domain-containing protein [Proteobacteria bacterium]|nr:RES domain-containing protein [Pseudomonadota bacterium]